MDYDLLLENNCDLLDSIELHLRENEIIQNTISEQEIMISIYEMQQFMVEQDTEIFMYLKYDFIDEAVSDRLMEAFKSLMEKIVKFLKKIGEYLVHFVEKSKELKKKLEEKYNRDKRVEAQMIKRAMENTSVTVKVIEFSKDIIPFINNYKPLSSCDILNTSVDAIDEFVNFYSTNLDDKEPDPDLINKKCPSIKKIKEMTGDGISDIIPKILDELNMPSDMTIGAQDHIKIYGGCTIKEFMNKYHKDAEKCRDAFADFDVEKDEKFNRRFRTVCYRALERKTVAAVRGTKTIYRPVLQLMYDLSRMILNIISYRSSLISNILTANKTFCFNMLAIYNAGRSY